MRKLLVLTILVAAIMVGVLAGGAASMCACGGNAGPPVCSSANSGAGWYGYWWTTDAYGRLYFAQRTYTCIHSSYLYNIFIANGIDPHAAYGYAWG